MSKVIRLNEQAERLLNDFQQDKVNQCVKKNMLDSAAMWKEYDFNQLIVALCYDRYALLEKNNGL